MQPASDLGMPTSPLSLALPTLVLSADTLVKMGAPALQSSRIVALSPSHQKSCPGNLLNHAPPLALTSGESDALGRLMCSCFCLGVFVCLLFLLCSEEKAVRTKPYRFWTPGVALEWTASA